MLEALALAYEVVKDGATVVTAFVRRRRRNLSPSEIVARRQKWKPLFEEKIWEAHRSGRARDSIIRDMKRIDRYPKLDDARGISPWFRAGLMGTYHRGILLGLGWTTLARRGDQWTLAASDTAETNAVKVMLIGRVLYEDVESVDWDGDEFYGLPHIYCFFAHKREPYEDVAYYTETKPEPGLPFYTEIASYHSVRRLSKKLGIGR